MLAARSRSTLTSITSPDLGVEPDFEPDFEPRMVQLAYVRAPLFAAGDLGLLASRLVTIVGTRHPSAAGVARASRLARELVRAGVVVVSGLALGIDAAAHRAAIAAGGRTIAVAGTPLDVVYPARHALLQVTIAREHLLLSPFAPGAAITRGNFPRRDRVLAELAAAVVVIEAGDGSGTLHTAAHALRLGRPLFLARSLLRTKATWPARFLGKPAVHVLTESGQVLRAL